MINKTPDRKSQYRLFVNGHGTSGSFLMFVNAENADNEYNRFYVRVRVSYTADQVQSLLVALTNRQDIEVTSADDGKLVGPKAWYVDSPVAFGVDGASLTGISSPCVWIEPIRYVH